MDNVLLVVITDMEYKGLLPYLQITEPPTYVGLAVIQKGYISGRLVNICKLADMGSKTKGSVGSTLATVISSLKPSLVLEVGICFGLKSDFNIGDVCICKLTCDYEYQKVEDGVTKNRVRSINASESILSRLSFFGLNYKSDFAVRTGVYACGDKVVDDKLLKESIIRAVPDAVVGDMESYTLAMVCEERSVPWAVVKSSCDNGIDKDDKDQMRAANNAARFVSEFFEANAEVPGAFTDLMELDEGSDINYFISISQEITGKQDFRSDTYAKNRTGFHIHHHPDMEGAWVIVYLYKARSIPEALRTLLRTLKSAPVRIDLCIVSKDIISDQKINAYSEQLSNAGCRNIYIDPIKKFIFNRIVKGLLPEAAVIPESRYVDQKVYREGTHPISSRLYASNFIRHKANASVVLKPISVILGQGGVGKTTLCRSIASHFDRLSASDEYLLLVTKSDILNGYSGMPINSIVDLYREYRNEYGATQRTIGDRSFELALSSGSIVMMIDGIDEIESALVGNFNMEGFIDSIGELNTILKSCRVFLTSRHLGAQRFESLDNAEVLQLKGFSSDDVDEYLEKLNPAERRSVQRIVGKIKTSGGFVNPYLLSIASQIFSEIDDAEEDYETKTLESSEPFEYILSRLLGREIEKQSLGITIDSYYDLLDHIVIDCGNSISVEDFQGYIETMLCSTGTSLASLTDSYLKCLLFKISNDRISIDHEEYVSLIRVKALSKAFCSEGEVSANDIGRVMAVLGADYNDNLGVKEALLNTLWGRGVSVDAVNAKLVRYLDGFKSEISNHIPRAARAIYSLHLFAFRFNRAKDSSEATAVLELLHGSGKISHLHVFGEFPILDLSGKILELCEFQGFKRFLRCRVDNGTVFRRCRFINSSDLYSSVSFTSSMFDGDCFLDEAMKLAIAQNVDKREGREARLRADIKQVLKSMRHGLGFNSKSMNRIKQSTNLLSGKSYESLLSDLCLTKVLISDTEAGTYGVHPDAQSDSFILCEEGHVRGIIKNAIENLVL